ncbi:MAG: MBL fold metallo-hydrolase [Candidatus Aenigmarchaeota archaeon]|nr:MBL fold metallo-hydrolase [Candidatus Aenigmarchaeota archaeon]
MIEISFLGAMGTVGNSAILVDTATEKILLDYGTRPREIPPKFPIPLPGKPDTVLLSHCHLDHSGALPLFFRDTEILPIYGINITRPLTELLLLDSIKVSREEGIELPFERKEIWRTLKNFVDVNYREEFKIHRSKITLYDAGHVPGSAIVSIVSGKKHLLYTGDFNTIDTRLLRKCDEIKEPVDVMMVESTYSDRDHPPRKSQEKELIKIVRQTLANDGVALIAGFAIGRIAELLLTLDAYGIDYPVFVDGMAKKAITITNRYRNLLSHPKSLDKTLEKVEYVTKHGVRKKIVNEPCVILTTSGMVQGGPIVYYLKKLYDKKFCSLVLAGWQLEGTPGKTLLETGRYINEKFGLNLEVKMLVRRLDFSSHVGRSELFKFIEKVNPEKVFCIHGDHTEEFANELRKRGFDAVAPVASNRVFRID